MYKENENGCYYTILKTWRVEGTRNYRMLIECQCGNIKEKARYVGKKAKTCGDGCPISFMLRSLVKKDQVFKSKFPPGELGLRRLFGLYRGRAVKIGRVFDLTLVDFRYITGSNCHYCGKPPSMVYYHTRKGSPEAVIEHNKYVYSSVDRVDSSGGYTLDNCVPACKLCNNMKVNHAVDDFLSHVAKIYKHTHMEITEE